MAVKWTKKGRIYQPLGVHQWGKTHASMPTVEIIDSDVLRIYYATRDAQNQSSISYIDVSASDPGNVLYECDGNNFAGR